MENKLLGHALKYAAFGWRVHPCRKDKRPILSAWQKQATTDPDQIRQWWSEYPDASIGCACGPGSGVWVLDLDLPDGPDTIEYLAKGKEPLPHDMKQQTGSGGLQLFFHYNGTEIRNSSRKVGPGIDVRGDGGYIILPPSPHPSGGIYKWLKKTRKIPSAPKWLVELVMSRPEPTNQFLTGVSGQYGQRALADEIVKLSVASEGYRNDTLNKAAFRMGNLIGGGELEYDHVFHSLAAIAHTIGLAAAEAKKTIESGLQGGMKYPRTAPERPGESYYFDPSALNDDNVYNDDNVISCRQMTTNDDSCRQMTTDDDRMTTDDDRQPPQNIAAHIKEWVTNSTGSFTTEQLDREFCLSTRREKQNRNTVLRRLLEKQLIKKDKKVKGKYHILDSSIEWIDLENTTETPFPIALPFDIHEYVTIPTKAIIALAGTFNAGKTAFLLNTLRLNFDQKYDILYLMSEMGPAEFKSRIMSFKDPLSKWKKIKAASKSYDFDGAIQHYNPDGLTVIDFLEEVDGEYFKIASSMRDIYDSLSEGVAFLSIQKKSDSEYARGGQATMEKPRLVMTLDYLAAQEQAIVCALKLTKVKSFKGKNLQGHELHFRLTRGAQMEIVMGWTPSSKVNRKKMAAQYETERQDLNPDDYVFKTVDGKLVRLSADHWRKWQDNYSIDVEAKLNELMEANERKPFLKYRNFMFQLTGILSKADGGQ